MGSNNFLEPFVKETCGNTTCQVGYGMKTYFVETLLIIYCTAIIKSSLEHTG